jgi:ParB family chromosome partitioning protein
MTDNTTPAGNDNPDNSGHVETGTLEHIDPNTLIVDTNVRDDADLDAQFVASIKEHGVLVPIVAVRGQDGQLLVRYGQRRTLAAREAGQHTVPVYVRSASGGDDAAQLVERVAGQIVENDHRRDLTTVQRAKDIQQMLDAGVSVTKVAKALAVNKDTVKAAGTAGKSQAAMEALSTGQLSLTEAAALAEFDDVPGAVDKLIRASGTPWFDHTVAQLREQQASAAALREAEKPWQEKGFTILDRYPGSWDVDYVELSYLRTATGEQADETVVTNPAHWAVMLGEEDVWIDVETGDLVEEDVVDWDTQDNAEALPAEGLRHANTVKEATMFVPEYFCLDYAAAGLVLDERFRRFAGLGLSGEKSTDTVDLDGDDQDAKAAREAAEAEAVREAERRERRKVIALNKLGEAALQVRREFVTKLLARKTPPKGAAIFVAECLARDSALLTDHQAQDTAAELLGVEGGQAVAKLVADLSANGDGRAQVITLALVLGALESRTPKDAWRGSAGYWARHVGSAEYLRWLTDNGYQLAAVEEVVTNAKSADEVYDDYLAEVAQQ